MQIYGVSVAKTPTKGLLVIVGSGFRYFSSENQEADSFTLVVFGKTGTIPEKPLWKST
jgi:hypothetical protein